MVERNLGLNVQQDRYYLDAETLSYNKLRENGYFPQGADSKLDRVRVMEIKQNGEKEHHCFQNWQEALERLCTK